MKDQQLFLLESNSRADLELQVKAVIQKIERTSIREVGAFVNPPGSVSKNGFRCVLLADDSIALKEKLSSLSKALHEGTEAQLTNKNGIFYAEGSVTARRTAWLFPGFGSEFPHMLTGLEKRFPSIKKWLNLIKSLLLTTSANVPDSTDDNWIESQLQQKKYGLHEIGPFGSITSLAIQEILRELKVPCDAMIGHSNGENSALIASGILGYKDDQQLLKIIAAATSLPKPLHEQGQFLMLSRITEQDLSALLNQFNGGVLLAMKNCPGQTVLYVSELVKSSVLNYLKERRIIAFELYTDHPYHTEIFQARADILRPIYYDFLVQAGDVPVYSCVDSQLFPQEVEAIREKALQQWVCPVLFEQTLLHCYEQGFDTFIEIGPGNKLQGFVKDTLRGKAHKALSCSQQQHSAWNALLEMVANLWIHQIPVDIQRLLPVSVNNEVVFPKAHAVSGRKAVFLGHQELMQQFLQTNERITSAYLSGKKQLPKKVEPEFHGERPLLNGAIIKTLKGVEVNTVLHINEFPLVNDHAMGGLLPVIPFTLSMELIAEAATLLPGFQTETLQLSEVKGHSWLVYDQDTLDLKLTVESVEGGALVKVFDRTQSNSEDSPAFEGVVSKGHKDSLQAPKSSLGKIQNQPSISMKSFYEGHLFHGPCFKSMHNIQFWNEQGVQADFQMPPIHEAIRANSQPEFTIPGPMLDSCGQLMAYWLYEMGLSNYAIFPFKADSFEQYEGFPNAGERLVCKARIQRKFGFVSGSFDFLLPSGKRIGRLENFQLKMYEHEWIPPLLMNRLADGDLKQLDQNFLQDGAGIWRKILAKSLLNKNEYESWLKRTDDWQVDHLLQILQRKEPLLC